MGAVLVAIHPDHPEPRKIRRAVDALESGGIIAYPTDTSYGLGCDLLNRKAVERLTSLKKPDTVKPPTFLCADFADMAKYAIVENQAYRLIRHFLPGPYCFIFEATREVPKILHGKRKTVGIRIPAHAVPRALVRELGRPILSTTASEPDTHVPMIDPDEIDECFSALSLVLDGGPGETQVSTVVDLSRGSVDVLRVGKGPVEGLVP